MTDTPGRHFTGKEDTLPLPGNSIQGPSAHPDLFIRVSRIPRPMQVLLFYSRKRRYS
jgi:hypothetical protein